MKNKIVGISMVLSLLMSVFVITFHMTPVTFADQTETQKEVWKIVNVTNPTVAYDRVADINITVTSSKGVHIACSTNITEYFENITYWQGLGYTGWRDWLNGTTTLPYHWGEMDWCVSNGSLTSITYDEIQHWGDMYLDSGGGMEYMTFMGNTYMADWNLTATYNDPDIVSTVYWEGNEIRVIDDLLVPANTTIHIVFKIVITEPGAYTFNVESTPGVDVSPLSWTVGGVATLLVPYDYPTIQEAINAADSGDTIYVAAGTYNEQVQFTKSVTVTSFTGEAVSGGVMINPNGAEFEGPVSGHMVRSAVTFEAGSGGSVLRGVIIENSYASDWDGLSGGNSGIEVIDGGIDNVVVQNVNVNNVTGHGFGSYDTNHPWPPPSGWLIDNCSFSTTDTDVWSGMRPENMDNLTIQDCDVGPTNYGGILLINVNNAVVQRNTVHNTVRAGIQVDSYCTGAVDILDNEVWATNSANATDYGDVRLYGQHVPDPHGDTAATVTIQGNLLHDGYNGICVKTGQDISTRTVVVHKNNILRHSNYGVLNAGTGTLDAPYNWLGNETGPYHPELNPSGKGDKVSDNVDFKPWLVEPYPPLTPISVVYVDPQYINLTAPALSTTFEIDVNIANVTLLYGFEFKLRWNDTLINLDSYESFPEHLWGSYFDVSETMTSGEYSLAISAQSPTPTFNGSATLATLTFRMVYDPVYPENVTCGLDLVDLILGDDSTPEPNPILHLVYNGTYSCNSTIPKLVLMPQDPMAYVVPTEFDVNVNVTNIVNLAAFEFELAYNSTLLEVISVIVPFSAPIVGYGTGVVSVNVTNISPPLNGSRILATIRFKAAQGIVWNTERASVNCTLAFSYHEVLAPGDVPIEHSAVNGTYLYKPVPGDLNMDGVVDIIDLAAAANVFGTNEGEPGWFEIADLNLDDTINILDIIVIARNFGRTEP